MRQISQDFKMGKEKKRRGRGEGCVKQRGPDLWEGRISLGYDGRGRRQRRSVYGKSKTEVLNKLAELRLQNGESVQKNEHLTVEQWLTAWLESIRETLEDSSYARYATTVRIDLIPILGSIRLARLSASHIDRLYRRMADLGRSSAARRQAHVILRAALNKAVRRRLLEFNPGRDIVTPRHDPRDIQPLTDDQAKLLLKAMEGSRFYALFVLAIASGMRLGELLGLPWRNLDLEKGEVSVTQALTNYTTGQRRLKKPKTKHSRRQLCLPVFATQALLAHRQRMLSEGKQVNGDAMVFITRRGGHPDQSSLRKQVLLPTVERVNRQIDEEAAGKGQLLHHLPNIRIHDLRHTHATSLLRAGKSIKAVAQRLGHASVMTTLQTYAHVLPSDDRELANKADELFS